MSKKCVSCGAILDDDALFCDDCGVKQEISVESVIKESVETKLAQVETSSAVPMTTTSEEHVNLKNSKTGIVAFLFSLFAVITMGLFTFPQLLGVILGVVALRQKGFKKGLAKAAIVISILVILFVILMMSE